MNRKVLHYRNDVFPLTPMTSTNGREGVSVSETPNEKAASLSSVLYRLLVVTSVTPSLLLHSVLCKYSGDWTKNLLSGNIFLPSTGLFRTASTTM